MSLSWILHVTTEDFCSIQIIKGRDLKRTEAPCDARVRRDEHGVYLGSVFMFKVQDI